MHISYLILQRLRSIIDNPTTKINAAEAGVSVGNFRRTTGRKNKKWLGRNGKSLRDDIKDFVFGLIDGENGDGKRVRKF